MSVGTSKETGKSLFFKHVFWTDYSSYCSVWQISISNVEKGQHYHQIKLFLRFSNYITFTFVNKFNGSDIGRGSSKTPALFNVTHHEYNNNTVSTFTCMRRIDIIIHFKSRKKQRSSYPDHRVGPIHCKHFGLIKIN